MRTHIRDTIGRFIVLRPFSPILNPDESIRIITSHMSVFHIRRGDWVQAGSVIGLSGGAIGTPGAGNSTGPHVCLMVRIDGVDTPSWAGDGENTIDPTPLFGYH